MKTINLSNFGLQGVAPLSRDEMKKVRGGNMPADFTTWECQDSSGRMCVCEEPAGASCIATAAEHGIELVGCWHVIN